MKRLIEKIETIPYIRHLTNKYVYVTLIFVVSMIFFVQNDLISQHKLRRQLNESKAERAYYLREIEINKRAIDLLDNDMEHLEKFAREKFLMKRDNEDIFIFVEE